jgi:hypothetical protein
MAAIYLLDSGPVGLLAHNGPVRRAPIQTWPFQELGADASVFISEVADYEVRRELTRLIKAGQLPAPDGQPIAIIPPAETAFQTSGSLATSAVRDR